ncbi:MAG TPA: hypothetical protein VFK01_12320 [Bradyrhizobium sp.]|nr:hypothetical protein [Bradyrhizobium sp.]
MCARRCRRGRGRSHGRLPLRLSAFRFRYFLSLVFPFVAFVIRAEAALANASTGIGLLPPGMEHRIKSVVTVQNSGVAQLGR